MKVKWLEASAGCGKTTYLLKQLQNYNEKEVLFLSFSNSACDEIQERASREYNINVESKTLHGLAYKILQNKYNDNFNISKSYKELSWFFLLQNKDIKYLVEWLLRNDKINENITIKKLENKNIFEEEKPIFEIAKFKKLFLNILMEKEEINEYKKIFFTQQNSIRKNIKIDEIKELDAEKKQEIIEQIISRILMHENNLLHYINKIKIEINEALFEQENKLKMENNALYFYDLIIKAFEEIVLDNNIVFDLLKNIKIIMIDEAQDLSSEQIKLILLIVVIKHFLNLIS